MGVQFLFNLPSLRPSTGIDLKLPLGTLCTLISILELALQRPSCDGLAMNEEAGYE